MEKGDPPPSYNSVVKGELRRRVIPNKTDDINSGEIGELERPGSVMMTLQNITYQNNDNGSTILIPQDSDKRSATTASTQAVAETADSSADIITSSKPSAPPASLLISPITKTSQPELLINEKLDHPAIVNNPTQIPSSTATTELIEPQRLNLWERFRKGLEDFAFFVIQLLD